MVSHVHAEEKGNLEKFQENCAAVFCPELRKNKEMEHFCASVTR
jgi:hypothetical protein